MFRMVLRAERTDRQTGKYLEHRMEKCPECRKEKWPEEWAERGFP
jgi:RNA polymerase subunit RPABC4/transcription elongation factor Spt4